MDPDPGGPKTCGSGSAVQDPDPQHCCFLSAPVHYRSGYSVSKRSPIRIQVRSGILSYIHLGSSVCHIPVCHPVIFLSSCHSCGTLSYSLCLSNQTDQGDERKGFERESYRWRDRRWRDWRGRVWIDFSLFKPNLINMNVHSATCSCAIEL
jgi:hypothetical protein